MNNLKMREVTTFFFFTIIYLLLFCIFLLYVAIYTAKSMIAFTDVSFNILNQLVEALVQELINVRNVSIY